MSDEFKGFESANTTPVPDILFDELLAILTGAELKVLLYIIRRTRGFKKTTDAISLSQLQNGIMTRDGKVLDKGCGIKRRDTIVDALASLEKKNCITVQKGTDPHGDRSTTIYGIKFKEVVTKPDYLHIMGSHQTGLPLVTKPDYGSHQTRPPVVTIGDPQETVLQLDSLQETDSQEERVASPHVDATAPAFSENKNDYHSYRHDHTRKEDDWACNNWRGAHKGKTCTDYQAYIDSGEREETPTEPRIPAIQIGAPDDTHSDTDLSLPDGNSDTHRGGGRPTPGHLGAHRQEIAIGATDGHPTPDHPAADSRAADSVRADEAGEQETPVEQTTPARSAPPSERNDGAATVRSSSEPAPSGGKPKRGRKKPVEEPEPIPQEVLRILDDWDALQKKPVPRTERLIAAAKTLVCRNPTREELKGCRDWLPTTDRPGKPWYRLHGVGLWDIAEKIGQWDSLEGMSIEPAPLADMTPKKPVDIYTANSQDKEKMRRRIEEMKANAARKGIQVPGHHGTN